MSKSFEKSPIIDDIKLVFCSRPLIIILAISTFCRIIFHFFVLSNSPSDFGPDEGTYSSLAKYVSDGLPVEEFPIYGAGLYNSAKSFVLPSALLIRFGMSELDAVRAVASTYGLISSLVLTLCFLTSMRLRNQDFHISNRFFDRRFLTLLSIFTFFPSNFLWSTMGLRESGIQFWLITTFYFILKLINSSGQDLWKFCVLSSLALVLAYGTRPETALVFSLVAILFSIVLLVKTRKFLPLIAVILGLYGGQIFTTTPRVVAEESIRAFRIIEQKLSQSATPKPSESFQSATPKSVESIQSPTPKSVESIQSPTPKPVESIQSPTPKPVESMEVQPNESASEKCTQENQVILYERNRFLCRIFKSYQVVERNPAKTLASEILTAQVLENKRNVNAIDAATALPARDCQGGSREFFRLIECNIKELPYRLFAFLFRPLIFFDQGSTIMNFAAIENVSWLLLIPFSIWASFRKIESSIIRVVKLSLISFVILFASAAALYEGNLGTAFRHKSNILWPLIFILLITPQIFPKFNNFNRFPKALS